MNIWFTAKFKSRAWRNPLKHPSGARRGPRLWAGFWAEEKPVSIKKKGREYLGMD
jgi:hypothetical protein